MEGGECRRYAPHDVPARGGAQQVQQRLPLDRFGQQEVQLGKVGAWPWRLERRRLAASRDRMLDAPGRASGAVRKHLAVEHARLIGPLVAELAANARPVADNRTAPEPLGVERLSDAPGIEGDGKRRQPEIPGKELEQQRW